MQTLEKTQEISSRQAFAQILASNGNFELAAERLHIIDKLGFPDVARLEGIIAADPSNLQEMQQQIKSITLLETFRTFKRMQQEFEGSISLLDPDDAASAFNKLLQNVIQLTNEPPQNTTNINVLEVVMRQLPPEVRDALSMLSKARKAPQLIEAQGDIIERDTSDEVE